ncbi:MAG: hypothetical protein ABI333_00115 [bacterium]
MSHTGPPYENEIFAVERHEVGGVKHLHLAGIIDEFADLSFLAHLQGRVLVHLEEVRRINSYGVRIWIDGVRSIPAEAEVIFRQVPVPLVEQMNMVNGFFGRGKVESFVAPMVCRACGQTQKVLFDVSDCVAAEAQPLEARCSACDGELELDDIEEQYLAFLRDF